MRASVSKIAFAGLTSLLVAGCPQILGLFGATADEQIQIRQLRGMQQSVSPVTNLDLNYLGQAINEILAIGLPTFYGTDLAPYLAAAPWPPLPTANKNIDKYPVGNNFQDPDQEIGTILSKDRRQKLTFTFNNGVSQVMPGTKSLAYKISLDQANTPGITGVMTVQTTSKLAFQKKSASAITGQPYTFGRFYLSNQPSDVDINVKINRSGSSIGDVRINLSQGEVSTSGQLLPQISISGSLPRIDFSLNGRITTGNISLSGDLAVSDGSNRQELQVVSLTMGARAWKLQADGTTQKYRLELQSAEGKLSGSVTTTFPEYQRQIAVVTQTGDKPVIKYVDKGTAEPWR